jgi:hypothetical protein
MGLRPIVISGDAFWPSDCQGGHALLHARRVCLQQCGAAHKAWAQSNNKLRTARFVDVRKVSGARASQSKRRSFPIYKAKYISFTDLDKSGVNHVNPSLRPSWLVRGCYLILIQHGLATLPRWRVSTRRAQTLHIQSKGLSATVSHRSLKRCVHI